MFEISEKETTSEVYQFDSSDVVESWSHIFLSPSFEKNVLSFKVGMNNIMTVDEKESLDNFNYQYLKFSLVLSYLLYQILVLNLKILAKIPCKNVIH